MNVFIYFAQTLLGYTTKILPYLAIGFLLSGLIHEFIPTRWVEKYLGGKGIKPILYSTFCWSVSPYLLFWLTSSSIESSSKGCTSWSCPRFSCSNPCYFHNRALGLLCHSWSKVHSFHIFCCDFNSCCYGCYRKPFPFSS